MIIQPQFDVQRRLENKHKYQGTIKSQFIRDAIINAISTQTLRGSWTTIWRVKQRIMGILCLFTDSKINESILNEVVGVSKEGNMC